MCEGSEATLRVILAAHRRYEVVESGEMIAQRRDVLNEVIVQ